MIDFLSFMFNYEKIPPFLFARVLSSNIVKAYWNTILEFHNLTYFHDISWNCEHCNLNTDIEL